VAESAVLLQTHNSHTRSLTSIQNAPECWMEGIVHAPLPASINLTCVLHFQRWLSRAKNRVACAPSHHLSPRARFWRITLDCFIGRQAIFVLSALSNKRASARPWQLYANLISD